MGGTGREFDPRPDQQLPFSCRRGIGNEVTADINREDGRMVRFARRYHRRLYNADSLDRMLRLSIPSINLKVLERECHDESLEQLNR